MRMLVVDDDPTVRGIVIDLLNLSGHTALDVSNGAQALALLKAEEFDAVLLDQSMPEITGVEVLRRLRAMGSDVRVGFITGARGHPEIEKLRRQAVPVIFKPFGWTEFKAFLERLEALGQDR